MLAELNQAKTFLVNKFGDVNAVPPGTYAIPTDSSKGKAFMKVVIAEDMGMSDFTLWLDDKLTQNWYDHKVITVDLTLDSKQIKKAIKGCEKRHWQFRTDDTGITIFVPEDSIGRLFFLVYYVLA